MIVNLAYPAADLVLLAIVIFVFVLTGRRPGRAWAAAGLAFGVITIADSLFLYLNATGGYQEGTLLDALWPGAMLLLALAAWQPVERHAVELEGRFLGDAARLRAGRARGARRRALPPPQRRSPTCSRSAAILIVFVRTGLSLVDNARLLDRRPRAVADRRR